MVIIETMFRLLSLLLVLPLSAESYARAPFLASVKGPAVPLCRSTYPPLMPLRASVIPVQGYDSNATISVSSVSSVSASSPPPVDVAVPLYQTLWSFTRPHTFIGTLLTLPSLLLRLSSPADALLWWRPLLLALPPALLSNAYITGLNQITDQVRDMILPRRSEA